MTTRSSGWPLWPHGTRHALHSHAPGLAPRRARRAVPRTQGFTRARKLRFLEALTLDDVAHAAAFAAGVPLAVAEAERARDPLFAAAWDRAVECQRSRPDAGLLESHLLARAIFGVREPIYFQGQECGARVRYNDTLGMQMLQALMPEKYGRPRAQKPGAAAEGGSLAPDEDEDAAARALLDTIRARLEGLPGEGESG